LLIVLRRQEIHDYDYMDQKTRPDGRANLMFAKKGLALRNYLPYFTGIWLRHGASG
jgi:hypothetical protein